MAFVHLQISTAYSLLSSTISIKQLIEKAKQLKLNTLVITDRNVLYGAIPFYKECIKNGIKPIIGMSVDVISEMDKEKSNPLILLAKNEVGYQNLLKISSTIQTKSPNGIPLKWLKGYRNGLFAFTPGLKGEIEEYLLHGDEEKAEKTAKVFQGIFEKDSFYLALQDHNLSEEKQVRRKLKDLSMKLQLKTIVTNNVQYLEKEDSFSHECLLAIREGVKLSDEDRPKLAAEEYYLKSKEMMIDLFSDEMDALENTVILAESCKLELEMKRELLPKYPIADGSSADEMLETLCEKGLRERFSEPTSPYWKRLAYELNIIQRMKFSDYFLIVWDFMTFARSKGILTGPGRGSAAGSLVAYVLKITDVDPIEHDLLFERFLNPERVSMPDIDIDFPDHRRDEVIQYVSGKYGNLHVAQIVTFGTLAAKAAVRDVARAFGLNTKELEQLSKLIPTKLGISLQKAYEESEKLRGFVSESEYNKRLFDTARRIEGLPRHTSTHAAGVIISEEPLIHHVPIQEGNGGIYLTQYPMDVLEEIGLLKMDFLGLRNLTLLERIVNSIEKGTGKKVDLHRLPLQDEKTFQTLSNGSTTGIFQLESDGMRSVLQRLKPTNFEDIVAVNALYRPGPMENIPTYIDRKHGKEVVIYPHPDLEPILGKTYGVIVYQEQIMQIASKLAGFSLGEADLLRRAVSKKKKEVLDQERDHFVKGAIGNGYDEKTANDIYDLIVRFANYGFPRSHAVAYSFISYQLAYLKSHYPLYFMAALLTSVIGNEDKIAQYIREVGQMEVSILPPSVNKSYFPFTVEKGAIRYSLAALKGLGATALKELLNARQTKPFSDLFDLCIRISTKSINRKTLEGLIFSGALDEFNMDRATLLASLDVAIDHAELVRPNDQEYDLFAEDEIFQIKPKYIEVEPMNPMDKLAFEKEILGLYLSDHPVSPFKDIFQQFGAVPLNQFNKTQKRMAAGIYITEFKTIRTKKGDVMGFLKISDPTDEMEGVIFPTHYRQYMQLCRQGEIALIEGNVEERNSKFQFIVQKMYDVETLGKRLENKNRKMYLRIPVSLQTSDRLQEMKQILHCHKGDITVILFYEEKDQTIQLSRNEWINPSQKCINELENFLGKGNVILQ